MESIGKYKIEKKIGSGGFGEVFKGYDPFIKRHVAVKTCISSDEEIRNRFFQEAEIAGNLQHRNITTVYDFGIHEGLPYLIQEYLSGEDLDSKIKRRDFLPYPEKLYYLLQIARGLAKAHAKGVIHRDIKPANIRVLEDGTVKIMDFGIAKLAQQESGLTQTGMTLGTAAYLAPEQIRGEAVDTATDIFSFGVLAYELLTS
ncbi:MAG: serine/threonine-protein kinase [Acidobacteriota bacterium]